MSLISIPTTVSAEAREALRSLIGASESSATALAEMLCTLAENGGELAEDATLCEEAENVIGWAQRFLMDMPQGQREGRLTISVGYKRFMPDDIVTPIDDDHPVLRAGEWYRVTGFVQPRRWGDDPSGVIFVEGKLEGFSASAVSLVKPKPIGEANANFCS